MQLVRGIWMCISQRVRANCIDVGNVRILREKKNYVICNKGNPHKAFGATDALQCMRIAFIANQIILLIPGNSDISHIYTIGTEKKWNMIGKNEISIVICDMYLFLGAWQLPSCMELEDDWR